ncbi:DnaJ domain-containing protein [Acetobacter sp. AN02]|uniref:DnaJ domain-containing protein n=1 Tax=Acetobacter sp. AN02 TaxID=2894186 RepID=UPI0024344455|nr:DnaJ domain-containing protein [Acetobacter sp. AN02]MDG6094640.1 DnaJ domain-containing protein [Acetobacter sp. AN02]
MMARRNTRHRAFAPDPDAPERCCDREGCTESAGYRAPRSRTSLNEYYWFCLEHVREYNARWDYYKGMSPGQIEAQLRADTSWDRPSWKLGHVGRQAFREEDVLDPLDILNSSARARAQRKKKAREAAHRAPEPLREPLRTMGLDWPVSFEDVKARYKTLAKQHHPDANHGSREAEERLKLINVAYTALRVHFTTQADPGLKQTA